MLAKIKKASQQSSRATKIGVIEVNQQREAISSFVHLPLLPRPTNDFIGLSRLVPVSTIEPRCKMFKALLLLCVVTLAVVPAVYGFAPSFQVSTAHFRRSFTSMNMFERFSRVVASNVNNVIKNLEDPEKVIEQAVLDMQNDLIKVRQSYAEISATQKRMEKQRQQAELNAADWYRRAQLAMEKNDEELAREALSRRQIQLENFENVDKSLVIQTQAAEKLYASMMALETKITEAKRQKEAMIARARTAKTSMKVNDMLSDMGGSSSMEAFDRMRTKVDTLETQAEVAGELAASSTGTSVGLEDRFKQLEGGNKVDDELELLKKALPGSVKPIPELPAASATPELDAEYERLKQDLGQK
jgi:phage shock protein A